MNNSGGGIIRIYDAAIGSLQIENNVFVNNTKPNEYTGEMLTIAIDHSTNLALKNNHFDNTEATYEISLPTYDLTVMDASGCYWGGLEYVNITRR